MTADSDVHSESFVSVADPHFGNWSASDPGWSEAGQRKALRRLKYWMSKGQKPKLDDVLRQIDETETASLRASNEDTSHSDISHCHIEPETGT
jgi:hypothetical protein